MKRKILGIEKVVNTVVYGPRVPSGTRAPGAPCFASVNHVVLPLTHCSRSG